MLRYHTYSNQGSRRVLLLIQHDDNNKSLTKT